ncbi:hypothetical protein CF95_gp173 [Erwinia phage PhiEaH1]|jgi:hypothetical protein|uniref:Uncharacterized protein n=1 Tax=Erwinia phage PhiEaH1 TaxID=1401669 RepID=W8CZZ2_9CAUD|nr:hypothetical protein CF95_gp173 [Erwinia phage PhiEaH1]AGX01895.1 hypothetical protein [Erwinia phage PhiEaH1]WBF04915.1 hypothetical protein [Erwinia phage vB_Ea277G]
MVKQDARFHLVMMLSRYSNRVANYFERRFEHAPRERSSNKSEMREINEWFTVFLDEKDPVAAKRARELPVEGSIDQWIRAFERELVDDLVRIIH